MTIFLRTLVQPLALKLPRILCVLTLFFVIFLAFFDYTSAQIGRPGDDVVQPPPVIIGPPPVTPPPRPEIPTPDRPPGEPTPGVPGQPDPAPDETPPKEQPPIVIGDGFLNSLYGFIVIFGGYLVGLAGGLLNWAVKDFVIGFGDVYLTWGVGVAVENGWKIIRDVLNITFIFGIVYIGIRLIFDANDSSAKRSLGYLLAAALLINFSLFISKFVVDFSNSLAAVIYNTGLLNATADLGASFINLLGLSTVVDNGTGTLSAGTTVPGGLAIVFGTFIFMLMAMYALAAGAFLIFVRGIMLIFFMIFSPVMFLGWIFPQFKGFTQKYWSMFLSNAFMAPAYIFCLYLTFSIMGGFKYQIRTTGGGSIGSLFSPQGYAEGVNALVVFTLAIGMMLISISVAKRMGAFGGGLVVSVGNSLRKGSVNGLKGFGGGLTRNRIDSMATSNNAVARGIGRGLTLAGVRDAGDRAHKASPQGQWKENRKKQNQSLATRASDAQVKEEISTHATAGGAQLEKAVRGANQTQLIESLRKHKSNKIAYQNIVGAMTHEQRKKLLDAKDDEFAANERDSIGNVAYGLIEERIGKDKLIPAEVARLTVKEIDTLGGNWITANLTSLTHTQVDKLSKDSSALSENQKSTLMDKWKTQLSELPPEALTEEKIKLIFEKRGGKEIAEIPVNLLQNDKAAKYLTDQSLREVSNKLSRADKDLIESNLRSIENPEEKTKKALGYFRTTHALENWYDPGQKIDPQKLDEKRVQYSERIREQQMNARRKK